MDFLDLKDISERYMELVNPVSPEKIIKIGRMADLKPGYRVIDFGCGFGEVLALWGEEFGIYGVGIDIRPNACQRARRKLALRGLSDRFEIICASGADYVCEPYAFDLAACIGATFIWGGFRRTIQALKHIIKPEGLLVIGEPYWLHGSVPVEFSRSQADVLIELQLLNTARQEGFDVNYVVRASTDDWDRYESDNWYGLLRWIEENPDHPERQQVIDHLHASQEEYFGLGREHFGWALYLLKPAKYATQV